MYHLCYAILLPQGLIKLRFQDRLCIRTRSTQFRPAAPPPHLVRTDADAHAHSAPPRSGVQITPRRSALRAPCLCSRPLWRPALPASRCLPHASGSPHRCSESSALNSETLPPMPHCQCRKHMPRHVRGRLHHSPCVAARTHPAPLVRERYQKVLAALLTARPRKPVHQNATLQKLSQAALVVGPHRIQ